MKTRQEMFDEVQRLVWMHRGDRSGMGGCIWQSLFGMMVLRRNGFKACLQAGTAQWRILDPKDDDGKPTTCTHFGYVWSPTEFPSRLAHALGNMGELHAWIGIVDAQEIVDFSTHDLKRQAHNLGFEWKREDPPPYLWANVKEIPDWALYEPSREATLFVGNLMKNLINDLRL